MLKKIFRKVRDKLQTNTANSSNNIMHLIRRLEDQINNLRSSQQENTEMIVHLKNAIGNLGSVRLSENEIMTKIFTGNKIYLDPHDVAVVPNLVLDSEWEHDITHAWMSLIEQNTTIVDIGANFGYFGVLAAQISNRKSKVILFEANKNLVPYLRKTLMVNSFEECFTIENLAISDNKGEAKLNVLKDNIASSSLHNIERINSFNKLSQKVASTSSVKAITLDEYCKKNNINSIELIKMDIEGFEEKAYHGMKRIIATSPKLTLFIEFTKGAYEKPEKFYNQMLKDFGHVYSIDSQGRLIKIKKTDYQNVIGDSEDWVMPVFSKKANLATK
jgi:FkbM family methyltransferase